MLTDYVHNLSFITWKYNKQNIIDPKILQKYIELSLLSLQHFSGLDEAVYRNIDACKELGKTTRSAFGPHGKYWFYLLF